MRTIGTGAPDQVRRRMPCRPGLVRRRIELRRRRAGRPRVVDRVLVPAGEEGTGGTGPLGVVVVARRYAPGRAAVRGGRGRGRCGDPGRGRAVSVRRWRTSGRWSTTASCAGKPGSDRRSRPGQHRQRLGLLPLPDPDALRRQRLRQAGRHPGWFAHPEPGHHRCLRRAVRRHRSSRGSGRGRHPPRHRRHHPGPHQNRLRSADRRSGQRGNPPPASGPVFCAEPTWRSGCVGPR